jgi:hypothetical protein
MCSLKGPRPVFVDVLSIEKRDSGSPLWLAYAQFVRTFLLPLAAYRYLGWPLAASLHRRDGYQPGDLYPHLSFIQRWQQPLRTLVTMPYLLEKRQNGAAAGMRLEQDPAVAEAVLRRNLRRLRATLQALKGEERGSRWSEYPESADHYKTEDHQQKEDVCAQSTAGDFAETCSRPGGEYGRVFTPGGEHGGERRGLG